MAEEMDLQQLLQKADQLHAENKFQESFDLLKNYPVNEPNELCSQEMRHLTLFSTQHLNSIK